MAVFKVTALINWGSQAGWSETFYKFGSLSSPYATINTTAVRNFLVKRAACLTNVANISIARISNVEDPRNVNRFRMNIQGALPSPSPSSANPDVVNLSILSTLTATTGSKRQYLQRGLCDLDVVGGSVTLASSGLPPFTQFWTELGNGNYYMRDLTDEAPKTIVGVAGLTGLVTATEALGFPQGQLVHVRTRVVGNGKSVNWTGRVSQTFGSTCYLKGWKWGDCSGGTISSVLENYSVIAPFTTQIPQRCRTRQTGRPFDLLRGRQPNRT